MEVAKEGRGFGVVWAGEGTGLIAVSNYLKQGHRVDRTRLFSEAQRTKSNNFQTLQ